MHGLQARLQSICMLHLVVILSVQWLHIIDASARYRCFCYSSSNEGLPIALPFVRPVLLRRGQNVSASNYWRPACARGCHIHHPPPTGRRLAKLCCAGKSVQQCRVIVSHKCTTIHFSMAIGYVFLRMVQLPSYVARN